MSFLQSYAGVKAKGEPSLKVCQPTLQDRIYPLRGQKGKCLLSLRTFGCCLPVTRLVQQPLESVVLPRCLPSGVTARQQGFFRGMGKPEG